MLNSEKKVTIELVNKSGDRSISANSKMTNPLNNKFTAQDKLGWRNCGKNARSICRMDPQRAQWSIRRQHLCFADKIDVRFPSISRNTLWDRFFGVSAQLRHIRKNQPPAKICRWLILFIFQFLLIYLWKLSGISSKKQ